MALDPALELASREIHDSQLAVAIDVFLRRRGAGEATSEESLLAQFPDRREEVLRRLGALRAIDRARIQVEGELRAEEEASHETRIFSGSDDPKRPTTSNRLWIRCPHCHSSVAIAPDAPIDKVSCSGCLKDFSLLSNRDVESEEPIGAIAHFHLYERIGIGGFGTVWKAFDSELERIVAIKIPRKDRISAADVEAFLHEARVAAQLSHPNIVTIHEIGRWEDLHYIVSDFIDGKCLSEWIKKNKPSRIEAAKLCAQIARALHEAHECEIIHRDLKPGNILIDEEGAPHLTDFGLAKTRDEDSRRTKDGQVLGTPAYMSPEQAKGDSRTSDCRSDVYSLGVVLFELLTGELPFRGNPRALIHQVIYNEAPSPRRLNHNIERDLETICLKCLQKEPKRRFATALDVAEELERFIEGVPIRSRPIDSLERASRWVQRKWRTALVAALTLGLLGFLDFRSVFLRIRDKTAQEARQQQKQASAVAEAFHHQLSRYRYVVQQFSELPRLRELLEAHDADRKWPATEQAEIQALTVGNDQRLSDPEHGFLTGKEPDPFENWFVMDVEGEVRGHSPLPQVDNYAHRDYFRGAIALGNSPQGGKTYVSRIYKSTTDGAYKFGISAPIYSLKEPRRVVGVVMASILAGRAKDPATGKYRSPQLTSLQAADPSSFSILVGPFDDSTRGHPSSQSKVFRIVQHPAYGQLGSPAPVAGVAFEEAVEFPAIDAGAPPPPDTDYHDPLGKYDPQFDQRWIAGFAHVPETKMLIVAQDSYDASIAPMDILFRPYLLWGGATALLAAWLLSVLVWRTIQAGRRGGIFPIEPSKTAASA